jgi:hypothetical protein
VDTLEDHHHQITAAVQVADGRTMEAVLTTAVGQVAIMPELAMAGAIRSGSISPKRTTCRN